MTWESVRLWLKGWRTVIFNGLLFLAALGVPVTSYLMGFNWEAFFDAKTALLIVCGMTLANIFLRWVTDTAVGRAE